MKKSLRVLIIRNAYQQDAGGAEQYALNLAVALRVAGHQPVLVTKVRKILDKCRQFGIPHIAGKWRDTQGWDRWYYLKYPLFTLWYMYIILWHRIDVVHPQSRDDFVFATRAAHILGRRVVWTDHSDLKYILNAVNHYNPRMRGWIIKASKHVSAIVCASQSEKHSIEAVAPDLPKLTVIHNGVFVPENVHPVEKTTDLVVGTNARLVPAKGIAELLEGFAGLKTKKADLWLLGGVSGNEAKYRRLTAKLEVSKQVHFLNYVNNPNDYVAAMDIFVHASYHEAFSLAIIEAAMLGKPIIATNVGGTSEIIDEKCGILIEPKSPEAITEAIKTFIKDKPAREKLGQAAQKKAMYAFDFQKTVERKIIPLYLKSTSA